MLKANKYLPDAFIFIFFLLATFTSLFIFTSLVYLVIYLLEDTMHYVVSFYIHLSFALWRWIFVSNFINYKFTNFQNKSGHNMRKLMN